MGYNTANLSEEDLNKYRCRWEEDMRGKKFKGKVKEVLFFDKTYHNWPTITFSNDTKVHLENEKSGLIKIVAKNDFLKKEKYSLSCMIVKSINNDTIIQKLDYGCE